MLDRKDFTIIIGVQSRELATPVIQSLHPLQTHILIGKGYPSFSKLVNDAIVLCPTEIVIFCSHRVRPTPKDIETLLKRIDDGYGLATMYRLACFGFRKDLIRRIGFFDERFLIGGWEDNDFFIRLQEADIAYYEDESIPYIAGESLWRHPDGKPLVSKTHFYSKWDKNDRLHTLKRLLPDVTRYNIGASNSASNGEVKFKTWSESVLTPFSAWQSEYILGECIESKHILIFGGTGSLGKKLVEMYGPSNTITVFSRDENKHWQMGATNKHVHFIIGDIRDRQRVAQVLFQTEPHIIIIASAMKHVDKCEYEVYESLSTNSVGTSNVLDTITNHHRQMPNLQSVVFVSTDKACSPINTYGLTKALSEKIVIETAFKLQGKTDIRFMNIRYGNVLNSRGSIIEVLNNIGKTSDPSYKLTHPEMTRFVMTQEQSVRLINFAILRGESGDTIVPQLVSMRVKDLIELFAVKHSKSIVLSGLRPGEKLHEALVNATENPRMHIEKQYLIIKPSFKISPTTIHNNPQNNNELNSSMPLLSKKTLKEYLEQLQLL
jgi:nucleoside-diphosphate-sugar epimerase